MLLRGDTTGVVCGVGGCPGVVAVLMVVMMMVMRVVVVMMVVMGWMRGVTFLQEARADVLMDGDIVRVSRVDVLVATTTVVVALRVLKMRGLT